MSWWNRHGHLVNVVFGSFLGAFAGWMGSKVMPDVFSFSEFVLGPLLVGLGGAVGGVTAATLSGRKRTKWSAIVAVTGTFILLSGLTLMIPEGSTDATQARSIWNEYALAIAGVAGLSGVLAALMGTAPLVSTMAKKDAPVRQVAPPIADTNALKRAYGLMEKPPMNQRELIDETRALLKLLEELGRTSDPLAPEAKRVCAKLRSTMGKAMLDRAWKALQTADARQKASRGDPSHGAKLAESLSQAALEIADTDRDPLLTRSANECLQASRMMLARKDAALPLEEELKALRKAVHQLRSADGRTIAPQREMALRMQIAALQGLAKVADRADIETEAAQLGSEIDALVHSTVHRSASVTASSDPIEQHVLRVAEGIKIIKEFEGGGFGRTFLCQTPPPLNRKVVIKTLRSEWLESDSVRKAFRAEANAEAAFQHERVPRVLDYKEVAGRPFKVMEYVPGGSLRDQIHRWRETGYYEPAKALRILQDITSALVDFQKHDKGGVHRDLKPENILLDADGRGKLTDFGLAHVPRHGGEAFRAGTPLGTVWYMSPEQARAETTITPASDVYAMGVILYELFTGTFPYETTEGTGKTEFRNMIKSGELKIDKAALPASVADLVTRCLQKDPAQRPSLAELQAGLRQIELQLDHQGTTKSMWSGHGVSSSIFYSKSLAPEPQKDEPAREGAPGGTKEEALL